jgi:hypothetical protein
MKKHKVGPAVDTSLERGRFLCVLDECIAKSYAEYKRLVPLPHQPATDEAFDDMMLQYIDRLARKIVMCALAAAQHRNKKNVKIEAVDIEMAWNTLQEISK